MAFPYLNGWLDDLTGYQMVFSEITDFKVYIALILTILVVVVFSGFYPALVLAGFNPVTALKGKVSTQNVGGVSIRKSLVVAQFVISQILIISTIVISTQMDFFQNTNLGFKHDAVVVLSVPTQDNIKLATMKSRISELSAVKNFCYESGAPASGSNNQTSFTFDNREKAEPYQVNVKAVDEDFIKTYKIPLVCGRNITHSDTLRDVIINEVLVKKLGLKSPLDAIGKKVRVSGRSDGTIVGVIKSFHVYSLHSEIPPLAIYSQLNRYSECGINVSMTDMPNTLSAIEKIWNETFPEYVFDYHFLDQNIKEFYSLENLMLRLIKAFSLLAIFIGCLGLYGLVSFMVTQKTKEIGVRKVLGASVPQILWLFMKEFSKLIIIAFLIAAPAAWWVMKSWLEDFTFRISIGAEIFFVAVITTSFIAIVTVGYQSTKAALANPVKSLRTE